MTAEITHEVIEGCMVQIVSPSRLRAILDAEGSDYTRPTDFRPEDEWDAGDDGEEATR